MQVYEVLRFHPSRLDDYLGGRIDLRTLYLNPENDNEYFNVSYNDNHYELQSLRKSLAGGKASGKRDIFMWNHGLRSIR